jgi:hypothetical protein
MLLLATSRTSSPLPERMLRVAQSVNPAGCSAVIFGGIDSSCRVVITSMTAGPSWASAVRRLSSSSWGCSIRTPCSPTARATSAKLGFSRSVP